MELFRSKPVTAPDPPPRGAYRPDSPLHARENCAQCARMRKAESRNARVTGAAGPRTSGLPARRAAPGAWPKSAAGRLAGPARTVILAVAVCTVLSAVLAFSLT
ncbi:hypothetical protein [Streptomyces sp. Wb2n-11]|uniref:hypothetical protein n=1 Tax=Streptomyces sp. Wb2n-11 TaxID=1030533 RepID=UPI000AC509AF|nr:hypothetical protein [Streptomyces sp. Wb2n-11]